MALKGGDIRKFTYAGKEFDVSPDADVTLLLAGVDVTSTAAGNGNPIPLGKRRLAGLDGLAIILDDSRKDLEFIVNIQTQGDAKPYTIELISGIVYAGTGLPEGDGFGKSSASGVGTLAIRGKTLEQI